VLWIRIKLWAAKRAALFLTRRNLCQGWRVRLIHAIHDLHHRIQGDRS
jgi:hypothetical protein